MRKTINFMAGGKIAGILSIVLVLVSIGSLATRGLNFGLDFTGGTLIEVFFEEAASPNEIRGILEEAGYVDAVVVNFGSDQDILIRLAEGVSDELGPRVLATLRGSFDTEVELLRIEFVGPQVGAELRDQGGLALITALLVMMIYVALRFQYKFSLGGVLATAHDVIVALGFFSLFQWEFDLTVLAALLAVIGYSLNDTIVVSDRIRENFRKLRKVEPVEVINVSLTETLSRTLVTSLTTLFVVLALQFFGGDTIHGFALALTIGVLVGTYSSIYVAANILMALKISREDLLLPVKEGAEVDEAP